MAAMTALPHQHRMAAVQAPGQQQGHREGARIVEQGIGLKLVWQGTGQGIKEG